MVVNKNGVGCSAFKLLFVAIFFVSVLSIVAYACHCNTAECNENDATTGLICNGLGTCTLNEIADDYGCFHDNCVIVGTMELGSWSCDSENECSSQNCGETDRYCYYDSGYVWGDSYPEVETDCSDGYDNDCDELIDNQDEDCYECFANEECDDSNSCTADVCAYGQCEYTNLEDGTQCDDGNSNTVNDMCCSGFCYGETDNDGDGYGDDDCDDTNPDVNPGAAEVCCDEIDNNCDGQVDEGCECSCDEDCDDGNVCTIEECVDNCCVYTNVEDGTVCDDDNPNTVNDVCTAGMCGGETDNDEDGYGDNDCDDTNPDVNPGAVEICNDAIDNDCNGLIDCDDDSCAADSACIVQPPSGGFVATGGGGGTLPIVCGDGNCGYKEDCSNCPEDCLKEGQVCCGEAAYEGNCCVDADCGEGYACTLNKVCQQITGGVTVPECIEQWTCTDWFECVNGTQERYCIDANECGTVEERPALEQECEVTESPITGLFTFITSPIGYASMFIAGLFFILLFLSMRKK